MRIPRIFVDVSLQVGQPTNLERNASNHLVRVLRLAPGAALLLFNGDGNEYPATLTIADRHNATITVNDKISTQRESNLHITLAQGLSKGERMDYTLQKAVEVGVNRIIPIITERSVVKLQDERAEKRLLHWKSVIISACEQSGRNRIPTIESIRDYTACLQDSKPDETRLILAPNTTTHLSELKLGGNNITILVGPEGGLSEGEIAQAQHSGFTAICLGPRILRTETAAIAAISAIQTLWGDMG